MTTIEVFRQLAGGDLPEWSMLARAITTQALQHGEALFMAGEARPQVFVVNTGVIRMVYETPGGDTWIKGFAEAGVCFASLTALSDPGVTSYSAYAERDTVIEQIDYRVLQQLASRHIAWQCAISNAFRIYGQRKERRELELLTLSPEERYLGFLHNHPALAAMLRQRDIASYVRVTPVALSRIRARLLRSGRLT